MPLPIAGTALNRQAINGGENCDVISGGGLDKCRHIRKGNNADAGIRVLQFDERARGGFGGFKSIGFQIGRAHTAGDIDGENDSRLAFDHRDRAKRSRGGDEHDGKTE